MMAVAIFNVEVKMNQFRWQDGLITMVGLWLFISPVILGYGAHDAVALDPVAWNFILCGLAVVTISILTLFLYRSWEKWADIVIGVWLASSLWMISDEHRPFHTS
jgi:hypothetical protein